jgi:hemoglobin
MPLIKTKGLIGVVLAYVDMIDNIIKKNIVNSDKRMSIKLIEIFFLRRVYMEPSYGKGDATYQAAGGLQGIRQLVDDFYTLMDMSNDYQLIRKMHAKNQQRSKDTLTCFLSGWMGGEALYNKHYGGIIIPQFHAGMKIGEQESSLWIACMTEALAKQDYPKSLQQYLIIQLSIPAQRIQQACQARRNQQDSL